MIPEEAVEAAARAHYDLTHKTKWVQLSQGYKRELVIPARVALEAAAPHMCTEAKAQALEEAADEMGEIIAAGDVAEVAAPVEGGVGRPEAISRRDSLYEEPEYWLRAYAAAVRGEG